MIPNDLRIQYSLLSMPGRTPCLVLSSFERCYFLIVYFLSPKIGSPLIQYIERKLFILHNTYDNLIVYTIK